MICSLIYAAEENAQQMSGLKKYQRNVVNAMLATVYINFAF